TNSVRQVRRRTGAIRLNIRGRTKTVGARGMPPIGVNGVLGGREQYPFGQKRLDRVDGLRLFRTDAMNQLMRLQVARVLHAHRRENVRQRDERVRVKACRTWPLDRGNQTALASLVLCG